MHDAPAVRWFAPGSFEPEHHFYTRVLNAQIHPLVRFFLNLGNDRIVERYCHLKPRVDRATLAALLNEQPRHLRWAGCDLMHVTTEDGHRQMVVIETNSCPSGQKSMPLFDDLQEQGGYRTLVENAFVGSLLKRRLPDGEVAVIYDKNEMEATGYAAALADVLGSPVLCARFRHDDPDPPVRFDDGQMMVRDADRWIPVRAALRYVTQRPWDRLPIHARTAILNPSVVCLAGGRNKAVAAKAYDLFNARHVRHGLGIRTPMTIRDVGLSDVPLWVESMGGLAVVKVPYSNAGQGVYTLTNPAELDDFMALEHRYDRFIVQGLIGNAGWSSTTPHGRFYHVGTVPNRHGQIYVSDVRMMVCASPDGFRPLAIYARRAHDPLIETLDAGKRSWDMLGTNLSFRRPDGSWDTETSRLMLMDNRDFNRLGLGLDELIEAYVQTVMSVVAIDRMAEQLFNSRGRFRMRLFKSLNDDPRLLSEIML
ncbi:MAG: hypothetical protein H6706_10545 [Myxococcales bacterium]|nr:hypothetical protein [Myxococcales bacterium]